VDGSRICRHYTEVFSSFASFYYRKNVSVMFGKGRAWATESNKLIISLMHRKWYGFALYVVTQLRAWMLCVGFTFAYGSMFAKIWTLYRLTTGSRKDIQVFFFFSH